MRNIKATIKGSALTLEIDLSQPTTPSSTGKTQIIASSGGNQNLGTYDGQPVIAGVNVYTK